MGRKDANGTEIEEERERRHEEEEDQDAEESWKREREVSGGDLNAEYHHEDLCRRFISDAKGIIDI